MTASGDSPASAGFRQWLAGAPLPAAVRRRVPRSLKDRVRGAPESAPAPEPEPDPPPPPVPVVDAQTPPEDGMVDVEAVVAAVGVDELNAAADRYFRTNESDRGFYFIKPFTGVDEGLDHIVCFSQLVAGLRPLPGMRILDFGAGSCWTSRLLTQMGFAVVATDVSETALELGRELFRRLPVIGEHVPPEFVRFDGRSLPLEDGSVDRVFCFDAFHHVPNPAEVLAELGRVLRDGGIAGFNEPGPNHSRTRQSQFEMRNFTVVERDILMGRIEGWARDAGFTGLELNLFDTRPHRVDLDRFDDFLRGGDTAVAFTDEVRAFLGGRRMFFLSKGEGELSDSRRRDGLLAMVEIVVESTTVDHDRPLRGRAVVRNTGASRWLPSSDDAGGVRIGVHLYTADGALIARDWARVHLTDRPVEPGEEVVVETFEVHTPAPGRYRYEFDMVSEHVCWFEVMGSEPVALDVEIR